MKRTLPPSRRHRRTADHIPPSRRASNSWLAATLPCFTKSGCGRRHAVWTAKFDANHCSQFGRPYWRALGSPGNVDENGQLASPRQDLERLELGLTAYTGQSDDTRQPVQYAPSSHVIPALFFPRSSRSIARQPSTAVTSIDAQPKAPARENPRLASPSGTSIIKSPGRSIIPTVIRAAIVSPTGSTGRRFTVTSRGPTRCSARPLRVGNGVAPRRAVPRPVYVTDETVNPPDRVFRHSLESAIVRRQYAAHLPCTGRPRPARPGRCRDGEAPSSHDAAVDGKNEGHLPASDGIFDEPVEAFDLDVSSFVGPGNHLGPFKL